MAARRRGVVLAPVAAANEGFVATRLKPAAGGKAWALRLYNASGEAPMLALSGEAFEGGRVFLSDLEETPRSALSSPLDVPAYGIVTLLIRVR